MAALPKWDSAVPACDCVWVLCLLAAMPAQFLLVTAASSSGGHCGFCVKKQWRVGGNIEWLLSETYWIHNLTDLAPLEKKQNDKQFTFRRFYLRSFVWDYECRWWVEEDHL